MLPYMNFGGDSGVRRYEEASDSIRVEFGDGSWYLYTHSSAGEENVRRMKLLALAGRGLNAFINANVKYRYESKGR